MLGYLDAPLNKLTKSWADGFSELSFHARSSLINWTGAGCLDNKHLAYATHLYRYGIRNGSTAFGFKKKEELQ